MNVPVSLPMWIAAFLPVLLLVILLTVFRMQTKQAGLVSLAVTIVLSLVMYRADLLLILVEGLKGIWNSISIILIVWTAIFMYQVGVEADAFSVIRSRMKKLIPNELLLVLFIGWIFTGFLQSITGFGVPVAVGAPLLIGIGVSPMWAVLISVMGQSWGSTYGTLAAAWDALAFSSGLESGTPSYTRTAMLTALLLTILIVVAPAAACWGYGGWKALKKGLPAIVILSAIQGAGQWLLAGLNTAMCCFIPSCTSILALILLSKTALYSEKWAAIDSPIMVRKESEEEVREQHPDMTLFSAFLPYILLSVLTIVVLMCPPVRQILGSIKVGFALPETSTGYGVVNAASERYNPISLLTQAGTFLLVSGLAGLCFYGKKGWIGRGRTGAVVLKTTKMMVPSALSVLELTAMAGIMSGTGQTMVLAQGIAGILGNLYIFFSPFVGLLGTFITGSNMSSNILFGDFQRMTADLLGVDAPAMLAGLSAGGAVGGMIAPSKIILGTTTAGLTGREGEVMKKLMVIAVPVTLVIGLMTILLAI